MFVRDQDQTFFPGHNLRGGHTGSDKELGSVGVLPGVGHGEETRLSVLQLEILIYGGNLFRRQL
jgi:hypothetical protein